MGLRHKNAIEGKLTLQRRKLKVACFQSHCTVSCFKSLASRDMYKSSKSISIYLKTTFLLYSVMLRRMVAPGAGFRGGTLFRSKKVFASKSVGFRSN